MSEQFVWPSDSARAESDELNRVCEYAEELHGWLEATRMTEQVWEKTMMEVIGEDGPASVADAIRKVQDQAARAQSGQGADAVGVVEVAESVGGWAGSYVSVRLLNKGAVKAGTKLYIHPAPSVPEGYVLIEKGITPTRVVEAGLECFRMLNQSGIADDRTLVLAVFQDMLLAAEKEGVATTPQPAQQGVPEVLYDGYTVYQALTDATKRRTSPENVSDTLDAVVSVIKRPNPPEQGSE